MRFLYPYPFNTFANFEANCAQKWRNKEKLYTVNDSQIQNCNATSKGFVFSNFLKMVKMTAP
jgi:hypothetical protein